MDFYVDARERNPNLTIHIHPLFLSLTEAFQVSETNPDISAVSENDERTFGSRFYTSPNALPPLEMHFSGKNGPSPPCNQNGCALT